MIVFSTKDRITLDLPLPLGMELVLLTADADTGVVSLGSVRTMRRGSGRENVDPVLRAGRASNLRDCDCRLELSGG